MSIESGGDSLQGSPNQPEINQAFMEIIEPWIIERAQELNTEIEEHNEFWGVYLGGQLRRLMQAPADLNLSEYFMTEMELATAQAAKEGAEDYLIGLEMEELERPFQVIDDSDDEINRYYMKRAFKLQDKNQKVEWKNYKNPKTLEQAQEYETSKSDPEPGDTPGNEGNNL